MRLPYLIQAALYNPRDDIFMNSHKSRISRLATNPISVGMEYISLDAVKMIMQSAKATNTVRN